MKILSNFDPGQLSYFQLKLVTFNPLFKPYFDHLEYSFHNKDLKLGLYFHKTSTLITKNDPMSQKSSSRTPYFTTFERQISVTVVLLHNVLLCGGRIILQKI